MKLIKDNLAQDRFTQVFYSSENPNYPATNVKHEFRSKEWRSNLNGSFVINSSNNKIDFKDSDLGSELTSTIPSDTYSSSELASEIKTQLESVSTETYSVSYSQTTGLWTITSEGSYFDLLINSGTNQANNLLKNSLGFSNTDKTDSLSYSGSNIAIHTEESVILDLKTIEEIDTIALLWEKNNYKLSSLAVIKLEANATNVWSSPAYSLSLSFDDLNEIAQGHFSSQTYRYWRIKIVDPTNANLYISIGTIVLGKADSVLTRTSNGFTFSLQDLSRIQTTDFGQRYTDIYPKLKVLSLNFDVLELEETQKLLELFEQVGSSQAIFIVLDPSEAIFTQGEFWIYGKLDANLTLNHMVNNVFNSAFVVSEIN